MSGAAGREGGKGGLCFNGTAFRFCKMKRALEMGGGHGSTIV